MGHLNDGLYMFDTRLITPGHLNAELYMRVGLQCGLCEKITIVIIYAREFMNHIDGMYLVGI